MSKKPKIDKRLDKLFKGLAPEESAVKPNSSQKEEKVVPPVEPASVPVHQPSIPTPVKPKVASRPKTSGRDIATLVLPESIPAQDNDSTTSTFTVDIPSGYQDRAFNLCTWFFQIPHY